tara:strand:+ start:80 stop:1030 length:951 start_codon:yes stop_codon:yes gene_type:complete
MKSKIKNIFITGGAGMIGLEIANQLINKNYNVKIYDLAEQIIKHKKLINKKIQISYGSILDETTLKKEMQNADVVYHMAAMLGVKKTERNPLDCLNINITGTKNTLESCVFNKVKKIIFASSSEVYGEPDKNPISENFDTKGKTLYGVSKIAGEELCKAYYEKYNLKYLIIRYFNTYGPNQNLEFVIPKFIENSLKNKKLVINGDGKQIRSYTFVSDSAEATIKLSLLDNVKNLVFNVGNGIDPINLKNLALKIINKTNSKSKIIFLKNFQKSDRKKSREIFFRFCDTSKLKKYINWKPKIRIDEGIKKILKKLKG